MGKKFEQKSETLEVTIEELPFGGEGVAIHNGRMLHIPFTLPGERLKVQTFSNYQNRNRALPVEWLSKSPQRIQPPCKYFGQCGGCQYQHLPYENQLQLKHHQLQELFRKSKLPEIKVLPVIPSPKTYHYRNKITMGQRDVRLGFTHVDHWKLMDIDECLLATPEVQLQITETRRKIAAGEIPSASFYNWEFREKEIDELIPRSSFHQVNSFLLPRMIEEISRRIPAGIQRLWDVYCGAGLFGFALAGKVQKVIGIELNKHSIQLAIQLAEKYGLKEKTEFIEGRAEEVLPQRLSSELGDVVLIDPPRKGCARSLLDALIAHPPELLVYVSCNPSSLAQDLRVLSSRFEILEIQPLDMFPQTQHVECLSFLKTCSSKAHHEDH